MCKRLGPWFYSANKCYHGRKWSAALLQKLSSFYMSTWAFYIFSFFGFSSTSVFFKYTVLSPDSCLLWSSAEVIPYRTLSATPGPLYYVTQGGGSCEWQKCRAKGDIISKKWSCLIIQKWNLHKPIKSKVQYMNWILCNPMNPKPK